MGSTSLYGLPEDVRKAITPLAKNDPKLFASYCSFFSESFSRFGNGKTYGSVCERWYQLGAHQPATAEKILLLLNQQYGAADTPLQGWSYFWRQRSHEAPPELRPYLEYLFGEFRFAMRELPPQENVPETPIAQMEPYPLAKLVYSAQMIGQLAEITSITDVQGTPMCREAQRNLALLETELCKTANGQDRSSLMWIRELAQNSRDALREVRENTQTQINRQIELESFYRDGFFGTTVRDPVGMSLHNLLYYLLVPDNSSKSSSKHLSGFFGHGFYTTFLGASQVEIVTSLGDGTAYKITIACEHDDGGRLKGLSLMSFSTVSSDFKGTEITRFERCDRVAASLKHALVSDAAYRYLSTVDAGECAITFNGERINASRKNLSTVGCSLGAVSLSTLHDGFSRVTIDDLYLTHMSDHKFGKYVPEILRSTLDRVGFALDLPSGLRPTRTRNALSREEHILEDLQRMVGISSLVAPVKLFMEEDFDIPGIPRDYLYQRALSTVSDPQVLGDAEKVNQYLAEPEQNQHLLGALDLGKYVKAAHGHKLSQLLTLIRVPMNYDGRVLNISLVELRDVINQGAQRRDSATLPSATEHATESAPPTLELSRLALGVGFRQQVQSASDRVAPESSHTPVPDVPVPERIETMENADMSSAERDLLALMQKLLTAIDPTVGLAHRRDPNCGFDCAYIYAERAVTVNLASAYVRDAFVKPLEAIAAGRATRNTRDAFVGALFDILTHEMTHASDGSGWTHQNDTRFSESFRVRLELLRRKILQQSLAPDFFARELSF